MNHALQETRPLIAGEAMTVQGVVNKTAILLVLVSVAAWYTWNVASKGNAGAANALMIAGGIGGFILAIVTTFKKA